MKKILYFGLLLLCFPTILFAQEKVDAPVWNVGDKWTFSNKGTIEVVNADQNSYTLKFSDDICVAETWGFNTIVFEKSTLNKIYYLEGDKRKKYTKGRRRIFNFPLSPGKQWKDAFRSTPLVSIASDKGELEYYGHFKVLGWEDIEVPAGKFRALKLDATVGHKAGKRVGPYKSTSLYWYSPDVKYFVKCQYDPNTEATFWEIVSWELTAFKLKK
jgi:hypothetical protein